MKSTQRNNFNNLPEGRWREPELILAGAGAGISQVNTDTPGVIRVTLALPADPFPEGEWAENLQESRCWRGEETLM